MRREAGWFVRERMLRLSMVGIAGAGVLMGLGVGVGLFVLVQVWVGYGWGLAAYGAVAGAVLVAVLCLDRPVFGWGYEKMRKGAEAETLVGQTIEQAMFGTGCAVVHSVREVAKIGDVDHLVATPVGLWVVETKYARVPRSAFPAVLNRIAPNVKAVREWAPAGTEVRGALVLAKGEKAERKERYLEAGEYIWAFRPAELMTTLADEARSSRRADVRLAEEVWRLGRKGAENSRGQDGAR